MPNFFSKEERVAFEDILQGFNDALVESRQVAKYGTDGTLMERASDTIWRPMPYILSSQSRTIGSAVVAQDVTQLTVPSRLNQRRNVSWTMTALELRDQLQENRLGKAAYQRIASDINTTVRNTAALQGTLVVPITGASGTYDHIAAAENIMNEQGVPMEDRTLVLNTRDYNGLASNLANINRSFTGNKSADAFERSYVGPVAGFETFKSDGTARITGINPGALTIATNGAQVRFVPRALDVNGNNVDNRTQQVTVSSTTGVVAGSCFTVAGIESVHQITKQATGQAKTFRVISVDSGTTMTISPPMIGANSAPTAAELQYKNIEVVSTSATAAITWLNRNTTGANPFWHRDSIELLLGRYAVPTDQGVAVMKGTTDQGLEVVMSKRFDNSTFTSLYTLDTFFGTVNTNPEQNGIILFGQP